MNVNKMLSDTVTITPIKLSHLLQTTHLHPNQKRLTKPIDSLINWHLNQSGIGKRMTKENINAPA